MSAASLQYLSRQRNRLTGTPRAEAALAGSGQALRLPHSLHAVAPAHSLLPKSEPDQNVITTHPSRTVPPRARVPLGLPAGTLDALENAALAPRPTRKFQVCERVGAAPGAPRGALGRVEDADRAQKPMLPIWLVQRDRLVQ